MPTRIVLRENEAPSPMVQSKNRSFFSGYDRGIDEEKAVRGQAGSFVTPRESIPSRTSQLSPSRASSSRRIVGFRSSFIREIPQEEVQSQQKRSDLSRTDIRASPRLMGYLFQLLACSVMLITVIQFYRDQRNEKFLALLALNQNHDDLSMGDKRIFSSVNGPVYYWKLMGCVAVGSAGVFFSLLVLIVHFDTVCLPRLWFVIFRDGSKVELLLLWAMVLFWVVGLYVCTSSLSVGEVQANVFFTTWICFIAAALNCGVWRVSAGLPSLAEQVSNHHRETTYNWLWTLLFASTFAGAVSDIYFCRKDVTLRFRGKDLDLSERAWIIILSIVWGCVGICITAVLLNHYLHQEISFKICGGKIRFLLGWRQLEGIVILVMVVIFFWLIYAHTGANGLINGLTNAYFGCWGSFFNSVFTFGTWLRENKDIEYIVRNKVNSNRGVRR
jgi:hypothetical protein